GNHAELTPEHYREMSARAVLLRLQENIKTRLLREIRLEDALGVVETMLLFAPDTSYLWRECGLLQARLDRTQEAVASLEEHLRRSSGAGARYNASILLQKLRARLN
ncbi:MAG: tetratricopeptide repeat protein, partial [Pseudomonadota bacterium]|nr:tetratricopeptide repeat protein [Pseudomonadota bacterium]